MPTDHHPRFTLGLQRPIQRHALALAVSALCASGISSAQPASPASPASPADSQLPSGGQARLPAVTVTDFRGAQVKSTKYSRDLQDTPRLITVLPEALLQEQGTTSLKDALRNIPGISMQAGEGNPPSGDQLKIRGFNARDDINVNGSRDLGNYFRDPFYVDQIEVVKGPNSSFSGRGSAGGTINFVTKQPQARDFNRAEVSLGTAGLLRGTVDMNKALADDSAVRLNAMVHKSDVPGRDVTDEERYGLYAAYSRGMKSATKVTVDFLHLRSDDLPDAGLPADRNNALGTLSGIDTAVAPGAGYDSFYGHTNDRKKMAVDQLGLALQHRLGSDTVVKNQTRLSRVHNDGWVSSPRVSTASNPGGLNPDGLSCSLSAPCVRGETKPRDQEDTGFNNQTELLFQLQTGGIQHDMVVGLELARYKYENDRRRDTRGPWTRLSDPTQRTLPAYSVIGGNLFGVPEPDGTTYRLKTQEIGVYLLDTMQLNPQWDLHAGVRWDKVKATAERSGFDGSNAAATNNTTHRRDDEEVSYNLGLVYKLSPKASVYGAMGNAYVMSANFDRNSVQLAGGAAAENIVGPGFSTPPEKMRAYEVGVKWQVARALDLGAALFRTEVTDGRLPAQAAGTTGLPRNAYHIEGLELLAAGDIGEGWKLYGGYTYLSNKITAAPDAGANEAYVKSQKLGNTPRHSFNVFTIYDLSPTLALGVGAQHVSSVTSGVDNAAADTTYKVKVNGYTVGDLYAVYKFTPRTQVRLNLHNVTDKRYISQLAEGGGQGIPGKGRQLIATLRHDF